MSLFFVALWAKAYVDMLRAEMTIGTQAIAIGILAGMAINAGLWISTLGFSRKHKTLAFFLLLPSLLLNTIFLPIKNSFICILIGLLVNGCALFVLFKKGEEKHV